jgi:hypothetical protein
MQLNWIPCHRTRLALNYMIGFDICLSWSKNDLTYMIHQCLCTLWRMACCQEFWIINSSLSIVDPKQAFDKSTTPSVSLACRCSNITWIYFREINPAIWSLSRLEVPPQNINSTLQCDINQSQNYLHCYLNIIDVTGTI